MVDVRVVTILENQVKANLFQILRILFTTKDYFVASVFECFGLLIKCHWLNVVKKRSFESPEYRSIIIIIRFGKVNSIKNRNNKPGILNVFRIGHFTKHAETRIEKEID